MTVSDVVFVERFAEDGIAIHSDVWRKEQCKQVPGARWDAANKHWRVPLAWSTCIIMRGVFGDALQIGPNLQEWAWEQRKNVDELRRLRDPLNFDEPGDERLYPFQRAGVAWMKAAKCGILADEMGSGKTVQSAVALLELGDDAFPLLVICPNSVKRVWRDELRKWCPPGSQVVLIEGSKKEKDAAIEDVRVGRATVAVVNYEQTWRLSRLAPYGNFSLTAGEKTDGPLNEIEWRSVLCDEAHKIKNPTAKQTRAVHALGRMKSVRYRWCLTGTPIANKPDDMWSLLNFCDPQAHPSKTRYVDRYCLLAYSPFGGLNVVGLEPSRADEFHAIIDPYLRRVTKELVLRQLPPIVPEKREVQMGTKQKKAYRDMESKMVVELQDPDNPYVATTAIARLTRLVQFASAWAEVDEANNLHLAEPSNKVDALEELMEDLGDEPVVVFAMSKQLIMLAHARLVKAGIKCGLITGNESPAERARNVEDFQAGRIQVILGTVAAGGLGITLTRSKTVVFLQRSWSMVDNTQAEARVHRIGSEVHESITVIDIVTTDTVDERMIAVLEEKKERLEEVVKDRETMMRFLRGK